MKNLLLIISLLIVSSNFYGQCAVTATSTSVSCSGLCDGTGSAFASGPAPYTYLWSPSGQTTQTATGLCSGSYTVAVTDGNNCTSSFSVYISSPTPITLSITSTPETCAGCCDGTASVSPTGGNAPYSYSWSPLPNPGFCSGTYICCVTDFNGCMTCDSVTVGTPTSIQAINQNNTFELMPNPSNGLFTIKFENTNTKKIQITNLLGELVYKKNAINQNAVIIDNLPTGTYIISVIDNENYATFQKVIINQ